ncbi:MAG: 5'/3'-nucleotidase SurE [Candidatus Micrarchaeota archaeon]
MRILVTNDDGDSPGLRMLLEAAKRFGGAYAIIPSRQRSAIGNAITLHKPLRMRKLAPDIHTVSGTPSDCVLFSIYSGEFPRPDLVLSGINAGDNTSMNAIIGSGTIGACWEAVMEGIPAAAFSMRMEKKDPHDDSGWGDRDRLVERTVEILKMLIPELERDGGRFFNVNFPSRGADASIIHTNKIQKERFLTKVEKRADPDGVPYYWISGSTKNVESGTDTFEVVKNRKIAISEISLRMFERD